MGRIPQALRETIARNIRDCRKNMYPVRGGGKLCAEAFSRFIGKNISPQQWSPWERGMRTPDESRLEQIAAFFGKTVEYMRRDNRSPVPCTPPPPLQKAEPAYQCMSTPELIAALSRNKMKAIYQIELSVSSVRFVPCGSDGHQ